VALIGTWDRNPVLRLVAVSTVVRHFRFNVSDLPVSPSTHAITASSYLVLLSRRSLIPNVNFAPIAEAEETFSYLQRVLLFHRDAATSAGIGL